MEVKTAHADQTTFQFASSDPAALSSLATFSSRATHHALRSYQLDAGDAIIRAVDEGIGATITVVMARQSGKNELAAQVEAYLLHLFQETDREIVKVAPTFSPQLQTSMNRLKEVLSHPYSAGRWSTDGDRIRLGKASIRFLSGDPSANVVGATASLLLAVDEAQDLDPDVYWQRFRPMASTTAATTVLYGTAWDDDNILEVQRKLNRRRQTEVDQLNFEAPWNVLGSMSAPYRRFVEGEIERLGRDHPTIRTQYLLEPVTAAGRLFSPQLLERMHGTHAREDRPAEYTTYVAGVDIAGVVLAGGLSNDHRILNEHDETVITIGEARHDGRQTHLRVVDHIHWRGLSHSDGYGRMLNLLRDHWNVRYVSVDGTGVGAGVASFLANAMGDRVDPVIFTARGKSELGFALLGAAETGRVTMYAGEGDTLREFWSQMAATKYKVKPSEEMEFSVPERDGHDDFVVSLALAVRAAESASPYPHSGLIRAQPTADDLAAW